MVYGLWVAVLRFVVCGLFVLNNNLRLAPCGLIVCRHSSHVRIVQLTPTLRSSCSCEPRQHRRRCHASANCYILNEMSHITHHTSNIDNHLQIVVYELCLSRLDDIKRYETDGGEGGWVDETGATRVKVR